ncbi:MAG: zinc ribbon domain-containing protein [Clostridia bacterium]|nr:zinc ribbon domain-containing protein [Clostridia bacterium]
MKFCTSCGNEMFDDAVICTKCGRMAAMPQFQQPAPQAPQPTPVNQAPVQGQGVPVTKGKAINLVMTILSFVSSIAISISLMFLTVAILDVRVFEDYYPYKKYRVYFPYDVILSAHIAFFISSLFCLTNIILSLVSRERVENLLPKISKFVFSFLIMLACVIF